jgi:hypothetical protein
MQKEDEAPRQDKPRRIKALQPLQENVYKPRKEPQALTNMSVLLSLQDVTIECNGEKIGAHSLALRMSKHFATILDDTDLGDTKAIPLPDTFNPNKVREFVCALYNCLDVDTDQLEKNISAINVVSLAELAHYFDAPLLHFACDKLLAINQHFWFPYQLLLMTQFSITHHLPNLRRKCTDLIGSDIHGCGLIAHLDGGRGDLAKDTLLMVELIGKLTDGLPRRYGPINTSPTFYETD